ncbi:MAG: SpoIIE family protein phosphatase [Actinomycetota bacterium]|nr:SpoIIE family protein phosphatase [Actinomycetota bacterium]
MDTAPVAGPLARDVLQSAIERVPTALLLISPGRAVVTFANQAAHRMAGGEFPLGSPAELYDRYHFTDPAGRQIPRDAMPSVRAAKGEQLEGFQMNWHQRDRVISLLIRSATLTLDDHETVVLLAFEDVTALKGTARADEQSLALLDTMFSTAPLARAFFDTDLRYVRVNDELAQLNGVPAADHIGRTPHDVLPQIGSSVVADLRRVLEGGEALVDVERISPTAARPEEHRHWRMNYYPVRDAAGELVGVGLVAIDETELKALLESERRARERAERAELRASLLAHVGAVLSVSLDYEETLGRVARAAVPGKADWCVVDMLDADGALRRLAVCHSDPDKERWAWELHDRYPPDPAEERGIFAVLRTGEPALYETIPDALLEIGARDEEHLRIMRELGMSSAIIVPLSVRGVPVGAMTFILAESGRHYGAEDLGLAVEIARRGSLAIEQARLYRERSHIARTLQRSLLPRRLPEIEGFEVAARYEAAGRGYDVGGDFYDAFETGDGLWGVVVGDVCGKGPEAAALTSLARYTIRAAALVKTGPAEVLEMANEAVVGERTDGNFVSVVHAWLDPEDCAVRVASAGHPPVLIIRSDGTVESVKPLGTLLGIESGSTYAQAPVALHCGDLALLYTDGILDAGAPGNVMNPEDLAEIASRVAGGTAADLAQLVEFEALAIAGGEPRDDLAILALRCT